MSTSTILERPSLPALRKRTKALQLHSESESAEIQLPSPSSSADSDMREVHDIGPRGALASSSFRRRRSSASSMQGTSGSSTSVEKTKDAQWSDIPLAVALIPPLGSFLTGGDFFRDFLLFLLLFFYLHQLIKLPWELYLASRPRRRRVIRVDASPEEQRLHDIAVSELRTAEFCYLALAVFAPLIGAALLRYVGTVLTGYDYISWFSTGIFVLVTGVRPWRHLGQRLRGRTEELQEAVLSVKRTEDLEERITQLEAELAALREVTATRNDLTALEEAIDDLDATVGRHARMAEGGQRAIEERFKAMERSLEGMRAAPASWKMSGTAILFDWMRPQTKVIPHASLASHASSTRSKVYRPRLAPVREEDTDGVTLLPRMPPKRKDFPLTVAWVEIALAPLRVGRRLLWLILEFLERRVV